MRILLLWATLGIGGAVFGCSDPAAETSGSVRDVTGNWCGSKVAASAACLGDEVSYLELTQDSTGVVTGVRCEHFDKECYDLQSGSFRDGRLTFFYTFSGFRVDGDFTGTAADTLSGKLSSNKCSCETLQTLYRIP